MLLLSYGPGELEPFVCATILFGPLIIIGSLACVYYFIKALIDYEAALRPHNKKRAQRKEQKGQR